ncbi:MAG: presqualene diphosphate synthase HpnD [Candidatus Latescibacteria bacterium]|nr:presqualene diphosphate synthase HpnD [Candidatus Latescibacterota bacterium]
MNVKKNTAQIVKAARTNFYYAFVFLPKKKREAIFAAYAFSRHTDDIVDDAPSPERAKQDVDAWRAQLHACYDGTPTHPIAINLQTILADFPIPKSHFLDLIDGVEMDLNKNRYATFDELYQYCYRVASVVGLICIEIFGYTNPRTKEYAVQLGLALQLTNILRDIHTDFKINRVYLPQEDLDRFAYSEQDLAKQVYNTPFKDLMEFQVARAQSYYEQAANLLPPEDKSQLFPAQIMGKIYAQLLSQIAHNPYDIFNSRIRISNPHKLSIALKYWVGSWFESKRK